MRITIVIGAFLPMPPAPTGAIEKVWHRLAETFAARGHAVTVMCPAVEGAAPGSDDETIHGVRYLRAPRWRRTGSTNLDLLKDLGYSWRAWRRLPEADVTVTNCFWLPALLRLGRRGRAGALNVHAQRFPKGQFGLYRGAERISTVSDAIADAIRAQAPALAPIVKVIPNPVDIAIFRPEGPSAKEPGKRVILYTGRIHPEKGLDLLVSAYARLATNDKNLRLRLAGPADVEQGGGGGPYVAQLRALANSAAVRPIEFVGNIADPAELATALRSCDVYCYSSIAYYGEASPVAPLEAMACGAVPVVSDLPQFAGYVRDGVTGLVFARQAADKVEQLAARLRAVLDDAPRAAALRAAGIARARELSVERIADEHLADFAELTESVAARRRGRGA